MSSDPALRVRERAVAFWQGHRAARTQPAGVSLLDVELACAVLNVGVHVDEAATSEQIDELYDAHVMTESDRARFDAAMDRYYEDRDPRRRKIKQSRILVWGAAGAAAAAAPRGSVYLSASELGRAFSSNTDGDGAPSAHFPSAL